MKVGPDTLTEKLEFHGISFPRSILVTPSRGCPQQVVRVVLVDFGKRHRHTDKPTPQQTAADRRPTNQVSSWQTGGEVAGLVEHVTRMLRGKRSSGISAKGRPPPGSGTPVLENVRFSPPTVRPTTTLRFATVGRPIMHLHVQLLLEDYIR